MNSSQTQEQLLATFHKLDRPLQDVLRVKALMGGLCASACFPVVNEAVPPQKGSTWPKSTFGAAEHTLRQLKLLDISGRCQPHIEHALACEAARNTAIVRAIQSALKNTGTGTSLFAILALELRLSVYLGDEKLFVTAQRKSTAYTATYLETYDAPPDRHPFDFQFIQLPPEAESWYAGLPPQIETAILLNNLEPFLFSGRIAPLLPFMLKNLEATVQRFSPATIPLILVLTCILRGQFNLAQPAVQIWLTDKNHYYGPLCQGLMDFMRGDTAEALPQLKEAQKRWRRYIGKRKALIPGPASLCLALSLLASEDPANYKEVGNMVNAALPTVDARGAWYAVQALLYLVQGQEQQAASYMDTALNAPPPAPVDIVVVATADALVNGKEAHARHRVVSENFERLSPLLPLVGHGLAECLAFTAANPSPHEDAMIRCATSVTPSFDGSVICWLDMLSPKATWERVFDSLTHSLCVTDAAENTSSGKKSVARKRLVWLLDLSCGFVSPVEQSSKSENWTAGRPASLKRLCDERTSLDWLTDHDQRILNAATWTHRWHGINCFIDPVKALPELVGHPLLFDNATREPITLTRREVELVVAEHKGGYSISLSRPAAGPGKTCFELGEHQMVREANGNYCLYQTPPKLASLAPVLGAGGLSVPKAGAAKVLQFIRDMDPAVPLRTDLHAVAEKTASPLPVVQLRPFRGGLLITTGVRPFGTLSGTGSPLASNPFFPTGQGNMRPLAEISGQTHRVTRCADDEHRAALELVRACPTLCGFGESGPWELVELEDALTVLLELKTFADENPAKAPVIEWPEGETLRVECHVNASSLSVQIQHKREWFQVQGELAVNERLVLDMGHVLNKLGESKGQFVPLGNGAFLALTQQFKRQLQRLGTLSESDKDGKRRVHPLGISAMEAALDGVRSLTVDEAWTAMLTRIRAAETHTPRLPSTLHAELRDYQLEGFAWLSRLAHWGAGACLADDMGLGKTVQTIAALLEQAPKGPMLVVAPTSVCHNWEAELDRFAPSLRVQRVLPGSAAVRSQQVAALGPNDVLIVSYGLLHTATAILATRPWQVVVFDEAQALKNAATKRARASKALQAQFRVALTGTPIENYLEDVWSLFNTINPGLLGTLKSFQQRFGGSGSEARQALKALLRPFILRRTKSTVLTELPPRTEQVLEVALPPDERAFYEALRRKALEELEKKTEEGAGQRKLSILAELTRLRRACCHPSLIDPETPLAGAKLAAFLELTDDLLRGRHKALVFSQFVGHLSIVRQALDARGIPYQYLDGATPESERQARVRAFQDGEGELFLISLKAGGQGLNLTAADYVIHLDPWWNPAVEDQASDRAHRIGQKRPVTVYRLVVAGSVEGKILALHASKRSLATDFLEGTNTPLTEGELLSLFAGIEE